MASTLRDDNWTPEEDQQLVNLKASGLTMAEISVTTGRTVYACKTRYYRHLAVRLPPTLFKESPYPRYDDCLKMEGDALVLPDLELPFHHAEFVNRCLELAQAWGIRQAVVAGDVLHFDSISSWERNWMIQDGHGLKERDEVLLLEFFKTLPAKYQDPAFGLLDKIGGRVEDGDPNISQELSVARSNLRVLSELFDRVDFILGNHEGRLLSALSSPMFPSDLLVLLKLDEPKWRIAPYYFSILISGGREFQIEHPKSAARTTARKLANAYQRSILMAHSHNLMMDWDDGKKHYALHIGHTVDELRLPYAAQRHSNRDIHALGAVIVRDGYPLLLHEGCPWELYKKMK